MKKSSAKQPPLKVVSELPAEYFLTPRKVQGSRLHTHTFYEIEFYLEDGGTVMLNNEKYPIKRNGVCISVPTDLHQLLSENGKTTGIIEASNTIGSIIGTFLPTFVTIPTVGSTKMASGSCGRVN